MGGIAGVFQVEGEPTFPWGEPARLGEARFHVRPRSTLARSERFLVAVSGHFDRAPSSGQSAAEQLLDAWAHQGPSCLASFEGAWVAAVYDRDRNELLLVRDPFGIRRLYVAQRGGRLAFASRLPWLLEVPWVSRELAREHLAEYLSFRYVHAPRTLLRDVSAVPPGHLLRFDGQVDLQPWFQLRYAPPYAPLPDDRTTLEELERRLNRAVAARASGRERVGVFLSGGLDSSMLTLLASRLGPVHTFTVGVAEGEADETPYAGRVAAILRTQHEVLRVDFARFRDAIDAVVAASDQPVTDPAAIPQYLLARAAAEHVDVILSGDGGDEIFGGLMASRMATEFRVSGALSQLPPPLRRLAAGGLKRRPELAEVGVPFGLVRLVGGAHTFDRAGRIALLRDPGWVRPGIRRLCLEPLYREVASDPINEILHVYLRGRMAHDGLPRAGMATSLAGLALREPLLDRDLVAWLARLPGHWKVRRTLAGTISKWPLRQLLRPVLGRPLVSRPKRLLPGPWRAWLGGEGSRFHDERLALLRDDKARLFLPGAIDDLAARVDHPGVEARIWSLFFLDAWVRNIGAS